MEYLNKITFIACVLILINCDSYMTGKQNDMTVKQKESDKILKDSRDLTTEEAEFLKGVYNININKKFLEVINDKGNQDVKYFHNCAFFDSSKRKFIVKLTMESPEIVFSVKQLSADILLFYNENSLFKVDLIKYSEYAEFLFRYTDKSGKESKNRATPTAGSFLDECIERQQSIYESEKQFVEQQNNDGE